MYFVKSFCSFGPRREEACRARRKAEIGRAFTANGSFWIFVPVGGGEGNIWRSSVERRMKPELIESTKRFSYDIEGINCDDRRLINLPRSIEFHEVRLRYRGF